jgi:hypothetical protein
VMSDITHPFLGPSCRLDLGLQETRATLARKVGLVIALSAQPERFV